MYTHAFTFKAIFGFLFLFAYYHFPEFFSAFWITAVFRLSFPLAAYALARWQGWGGLGAYGLPMHPGWFRNLGLGLLMGAGCYLSSELINMYRIGAFSLQPDFLSGLVIQLPQLLLFTLFPSLSEDLLTRGYLYTYLSRRMAPVVWILLSASFFVFNHIWRWHDGPATLSYLFMAGLWLAAAISITRSLWMAFGIHWGMNLAFESMSRRVLLPDTPGAPWGNWIYACCLGAFLLLFLFLRRRWAVNHYPD